MEIDKLILDKLAELIDEVRDLKKVMQSADTETCTPDQAMATIGVNNTRYLTYFHKQGLLNRRKGGNGFLYFKKECQKLAELIRDKKVALPAVKNIYDKAA